MAEEYKRKTTNDIIADHWDWLEIDISTPSHPGAVMQISAIDWDYVKSKQKDGSVGRVRATEWNTYGKVYPAARLRGKSRSLLQILFHGTLKSVRCSGEWNDVRRENLIHGPGELKNLGESGYARLGAIDLDPGGRPTEANKILRIEDGVYHLDIGTCAYPDNVIRLDKIGYETLMESCAGKVSMKKVFGGKLMAYARVPEKVGDDGKPVEDCQWLRRPAHTIIHGEELTFATEDHTDLRFTNMRKKKPWGKKS